MIFFSHGLPRSKNAPNTRAIGSVLMPKAPAIRKTPGMRMTRGMSRELASTPFSREYLNSKPESPSSTVKAIANKNEYPLPNCFYLRLGQSIGQLGSSIASSLKISDINIQGRLGKNCHAANSSCRSE